MIKEIISEITFGESIAELEAAQLEKYFIETEYWKKIRHGKDDIIYGAKGSGKSAIYTYLLNAKDTLLNEGLILASAENPSGNTAFSTLQTDPPTNEIEFTRLWKLYFLVISAQVLRELSIENEHFKKIQTILEDCDLLPVQNKLSSFIRSCLDFVRRFGGIREVSTTSEIDSLTGGFSGQKFSIAFSEPSRSDFEKGILPIEDVYDLLCKALSQNKKTLWIIVDRLDVAFSENEILETNALKALFKTYLDLAAYNQIKIKIFLRDDIWKKITSAGFREASHITKYQHINWNKDRLLNLIIRRLLDNGILVNSFQLNRDQILLNREEQVKCFYRFFPDQVDVGLKKPQTLEWILSHTRDGKLVNTPREIIQLLNHARAIEMKRLENGINELTGDQLISRAALKEAFIIVSKQRIEQTIYPEHPNLKDIIEQLRNDKAEHSFNTLMSKWNVNESIAKSYIKQLTEIGFIEEKGTLPNLKYKIPFIYRPYLGIVQGAADDR